MCFKLAQMNDQHVKKNMREELICDSIFDKVMNPCTSVVNARMSDGQVSL